MESALEWWVGVKAHEAFSMVLYDHLLSNLAEKLPFDNYAG